MRRAHVAGCAALVLVTSGAGLTGGPAHAVDGPPLVQVDFDSLANGSPLTNTGSLDATVKVSTSGGGAITAGPDDTHGRASGSYPAWDATAPYQRASVTVLGNGSGDPLSPGTRDFEFGGSFKLDARSAGGREDNGDNLVQRARFGDRSQYKLQVDGGHVSCRIKGAGGAELVRSPITVKSDTWYATSCARADGKVTLTVQPFGGAAQVRSLPSDVGAVTMKSSSVRLSIGAKVSASGTVISGDADQFNGLIDDVYVSIARPTG